VDSVYRTKRILLLCLSPLYLFCALGDRKSTINNKYNPPKLKQVFKGICVNFPGKQFLKSFKASVTVFCVIEDNGEKALKEIGNCAPEKMTQISLKTGLSFCGLYFSLIVDFRSPKTQHSSFYRSISPNGTDIREAQTQ